MPFYIVQTAGGGYPTLDPEEKKRGKS